MTLPAGLYMYILEILMSFY